MSETVFTYAAPGLKFGPGASAEIGHDLLRLGARRVLLVTDPGVAATGHPARIAEQARGVRAERHDVRRSAGRAHRRVAERRDRVRPRRGAVRRHPGGRRRLRDRHRQGREPAHDQPGRAHGLHQRAGREGAGADPPLLPLVAVPTTTGTGSESTTICVLDVLSLHVKTGISHPALRPTFAVVDPSLTLTQPTLVTAAAGMDILCHALESYTARWYADFDAKSPEQRVPYCGANPIADLWSEKALSLLAGAFRAAVRDGVTPRHAGQMALAATFAGLGFGNAGVHIPHANAYPIAGGSASHASGGYPDDEPMVPHGMAVSADRARGLPVHLRRGSRAAPARGAAARSVGLGGR